MPWAGIEPATPTISIAQGRRVWKASEHAHMLCPAPESTKKIKVSSCACIRSEGVGRQMPVPARPALSFLGEFEGRRSVGVRGGYTIRCVATSYVASPYPFLSFKAETFPEMREW